MDTISLIEDYSLTDLSNYQETSSSSSILSFSFIKPSFKNKKLMINQSQDDEKASSKDSINNNFSSSLRNLSKEQLLIPSDSPINKINNNNGNRNDYNVRYIFIALIIIIKNKIIQYYYFNIYFILFYFILFSIKYVI